MDEQDSVRILRELDEGTDWSVSGDLLAANDPEDEDEDDNGMAGVPAGLHLLPTLGASEGLAAPENIENICSTVLDLSGNGKVEDIIVVLNLKGDEQVLFTTLERNDHVIGMLEVAKMNWHSSQIASQNYIEEE